MKKICLNPKLVDQVRSSACDVLAIAFTVFTFDAAHLLIAIYNGDFSKATLYGLFYLGVRAMVRSTFIYAFPKLFPRPQPMIKEEEV